MNPKNNLKNNRAFTLVELMIVILVVGVLSGLIYGTVTRSRDSGFDVVKKQNEKKLNDNMLALYEGGVDTTAYADATAAITALKTGVDIPSTISGGQAQVVKLDVNVNPDAYDYAVATATSPARFTARLGQRNVPAVK